MRQYESTHPWIAFRADLSRARTDFWVLLGEVQSKCEHVAGVPLPIPAHDHLNRVYLAKGALATTAIEGNTLSEEEVQKHLAGELRLPPSKQYLAREIDNIVAACNDVWRDESGRFETLTVDAVKEFNRRVLDGLQLDESVVPGKVRTHSVGVAHYRAAPPEDCEYLLERLCEWLSSPEFSPPGQTALAFAVLRAVLAHLYLAWIHPFGDGNGRTARLVEFCILVHAGVPQPSAHLLSNHYNATRAEYYRQLDLASRSGGDIIPFLRYAVQGLVDGLRDQLHVIRKVQLDIAWRDFLNESLRKLKPSESTQRKRHLALALSDANEPVPRGQLTSLTPEVARAYARKTAKAVSRDLNFLIREGLVRKGTGGFLSAKQRMLAFRPRRKQRPAASSS